MAIKDLGSIIVDSVPKGLSIRLDGETVSGKVTPAVLDEVSPGKHIVEVDLPDECNFSKEITVKADSKVSVCLRHYTAEEQKVIWNIGVYIIAAFILLVTIIVLNRLEWFTSDDLNIILIYIACSGGFGALAYSLFGFVDHLCRKNDFDVRYKWWFIHRPFIGIIYGTFAFLFVAGGLMTLSGVDPGTANLYAAKTVMFYCAVAFLAGYAEHSFSVQLKELAEAIFKKNPSS